MTECFIYGGRSAAIPLVLVNKSNFNRAAKKLTAPQAKWLEQNAFCGKPGSLCALPEKNGSVEKYFVGIESVEDPFAVADLAKRLPEGLYTLEGSGVRANLDSLAVGWGSDQYTG